MFAICPQPKGLLMSFRWSKDKTLTAAWFMEDSRWSSLDRISQQSPRWCSQKKHQVRQVFRTFPNGIRQICSAKSHCKICAHDTRVSSPIQVHVSKTMWVKLDLRATVCVVASQESRHWESAGTDLLSKKGDEHYVFLCACLISCLVNATVEIITEMNIFIDVNYRQRLCLLPFGNL